MFRKSIIYFLILALGIFFYSPAWPWARMESANYIIYADVFNAGGSETGASANYKLQESIGEATALSAANSAANYGIKTGFYEMYPDQHLTFSVGSASVNLGTLSRTEVKTASHTMTAATNASKGFAIAVSGSTLTSGGNTITAIGATAAASSPGTKQFGLNLAANSSPGVGASPSGTSPIGAAARAYATANTFAF